MVKRVAGLADTKDITDWENQFVKSLVERTRNGDNTTTLTDKQIERLEELHSKHFEG
jgi:hypothetical protein